MASNARRYRPHSFATHLATVLAGALCAGAAGAGSVVLPNVAGQAAGRAAPAVGAAGPAPRRAVEGAPRPAPGRPVVDAHVHLLSPAGAALLRARLGADAALDGYPRDGAMVLAMLDSAGTRRALVISGGYELATASLGPAAEEAAVRREDDWAARQVARAPDRLVGFCSVDPLREYALSELTRCRRELALSGVKLHFSAAGVDLRNPAHVRRLRAVFAAADRLGLALLVHVRTLRPDYGARDAHIFLDRVLPAAPRVPVQIAHLGGWGGYDAGTDAALAAFAAAVRAGTLRNGVYFDVAFVAPPAGAPRRAPGEAGDLLILARLRELGPGRLVFGSDWPLGSCASYVADLRAELPGDSSFLAAVLANVPPYLR